MAPDDLNAILSSLSNEQQNPGGDPGSGDVGPTLNTKMKDVPPSQNPLITLEMTEEQVREWHDRVQRARDRVTAREEAWDVLLKEYLPIVKKSGESETVKMSTHFRNVQTKIGSLFYREPNIVCTPREPGPGQNQIPNPMAAMLPPGIPPPPPLEMEDVVAVKQAVLDYYMGRNGINSGRLIDELLHDTLTWAGIGCCKVGYRCVTKPIQKPVMGPDPNANPMAGAGSVLGLGQAPQPQLVPQMDPSTGQPLMTTEDVPIFEEYYARRFSPKKLLLNDDLRSGRFDEDATFMGMDFYISKDVAMRPVAQGGFGLSEEEASASAEDDRIYKHEEDQVNSSPKAQGLIKGSELWVKASIFGTEPHPQALNQLVLLDNLKTRPVVWRPSPDQEFDPNTGQLTKDSMLGFPICVMTIRDLADSPFTPADSAWTNSHIKQLTTWRRQAVKLRDATIGKYFYSQDAFAQDAEVEILKNGEVGEYIGVPGSALANGADKLIGTSAQVHATRDDYQSQEMFQRDINETLGISSVQAGSTESTVRTATEISDVQAAVSARNDKERSRVVDFWLSIAQKVDSLLMRYADQNTYINITGDDGAQRMMVWNKTIVAGRYLYDIAPDSQNHSSTAEDFKQDSNFYNLAASDPMFNRTYMLKRMARRRGLDPNKIVLNQSQMMAQPPHGGTPAPAGVISQHHAGVSGGMQNAPGQPNHRQGQMK